jgi:hypothetical protein
MSLELKLTENEHANLKRVFDEAIARKKLPVLGDSWSNAGNFDSKENDVMMSFDYNKNPTEVPADDESKLRFIMQVAQQQGTSALANAAKDFTHDSETWVDYFAKYPLLFNFQSRNSKTYKEDNFTLSGSITDTANFVKTFLGYSTPLGIAANLIGVIRSASSPVLQTQTTEKHLQYLAFCRGYDKASTLTIYRAQLNMKVSDVKAVCVSTRNITLDMSYDEVVFEINNTLALALYPQLSQLAVIEATKFISAFFNQFAAQEYRDFDKWLKSL